MADSQIPTLFPNLSTATNGTEPTSKIYVFLPALPATKRIIVMVMVMVGILGAAGNGLILYFLSRKKEKCFLKSTPFVRNLHSFIRSLAISDVLSSVFSLPLVCLQIYFDFFQQGWLCKIVRYLNAVFPSITINNLLVISVERYLSTRNVPRSFSVSTVHKLIVLAWVAGAVAMVAPTVTMKGIKYAANVTHFTIECTADTNYAPFRYLLIGYMIVQFCLPAIFLLFINISLIKSVWDRGRIKVDIQRNNAIKNNMKKAKIRGTILVILTFIFIVSYFPFVIYVGNITRRSSLRDFQTDFTTRYSNLIMFYSNSAINVVVYLMQMKDFRAFLKRLFCGSNAVRIRNSTNKDNGRNVSNLGNHFEIR